jgi:CheY-like chemotaxis protein
MERNRVLVVDDDEATRSLLKDRLADAYDVTETSDPKEALSLAMNSKPKCILLDLHMPGLTGFELCKTLSSLSLTQLIPIMVLSGNPQAQYREFCSNLGAKDYFQKPIDFARLRVRLAELVAEKPSDRRAEVRVRLRVMVELRGISRHGKTFQELAVTDDVSPSGFRCAITTPLDLKSSVDVYVSGGGRKRRVGRADVIHSMWPGTPAQQYGFHFSQKPMDWIL